MKKKSLCSIVLGFCVVALFVFSFPVPYYAQDAGSLPGSQDREKWKELKKSEKTKINKFQFQPLVKRYEDQVEEFRTKRYKLAAKTRSNVLKKMGKLFSKLQGWVRSGDDRIQKVKYNNMLLTPTRFGHEKLNMKMDTGELEFSWKDVLDTKPDFFAEVVNRRKLNPDQNLALAFLIIETNNADKGRELLQGMVNRYPKKRDQMRKFLAMRKETLPKKIDLSKELDVQKDGESVNADRKRSTSRGESGYFNRDRLEEVGATILKAAHYLEKHQHKNGSHGKDQHKVGNVGMKVAITSLVGKFLTAATLVHQDSTPQEINFDRLSGEGAGKVFECLKDTNLYLFPADPENRVDRPEELRDVWETLYRIEYIAFLWDFPYMKEKAAKGMKREFNRAVDQLYERQIVPGGWGYYQRIKQGMTFASSAAIMSLHHAIKNGVPISDERMKKVKEMKKKAVEKIQNDFKVEPAQYMYRPGAASGENERSRSIRGPLVELSLLKAGQPTGDLELAIDNFFKHRKWVEKVKGRNGTHIGTGQMAPYYYLYHHYYTVRALRYLKNNKKRKKYLKKIGTILLDDAEKVSDGMVKFTDAPILGKGVTDIYGTALGGLALFYYARSLPEVKGSDQGKAGGEPTTEEK